MKWTSEQIRILVKKAYGNSLDENISQKLAELHAHWDRAEEPLILRDKLEWAEVERLANEISEMIKATGQSIPHYYET